MYFLKLLKSFTDRSSTRYAFIDYLAIPDWLAIPDFRAIPQVGVPDF